MHPEAQRIILSLREAIPRVPCYAGCSDCCGHVPFSHWEWEQIPVALKRSFIPIIVPVEKIISVDVQRVAIVPLRYKIKRAKVVLAGPREWIKLYADGLQENICVFLSESKSHPGFCTIYEHRPIICRLFATVADPRMSCARGCVSVPVLHAKLALTVLVAWHSTFLQAPAKGG